MPLPCSRCCRKQSADFADCTDFQLILAHDVPLLCVIDRLHLCAAQDELIIGVIGVIGGPALRRHEAPVKGDAPSEGHDHQESRLLRNLRITCGVPLTPREPMSATPASTLPVG